jgi:HD-like signal output (HDOD) protein
MSTPAVGTAPTSNTLAFAFVAALAHELNSSKIDLPSFPDVAVRVRRALADEHVGVDQIVRIVGAEPALAARLLKMANSAALNRSGKSITDLRTAINRMGYNMVRSAAISFAMAQIRGAASLKPVESQLKELWAQSTYVAAFCYVLARAHSKLNPDEAFLAGLLHGVGKLYILTRVDKHPALFADAAALDQVMRDWHANVGKAILENWEMPQGLVGAVAEQEDFSRSHEGPADLTDLLVCASVFSACVARPEDIELATQGVAAFGKLGLDAKSAGQALAAGREEVEALRQALGN